MTVTKVRTSRRIQAGSSSSGLPKFKLGQLVRGTVKKILADGLIQTRIRGYDLIASSAIAVSSGDNLLLRVVKTHPRPHLQVLDLLDSTPARSGQMTQFLRALLDLEIPVTSEMLQAFSEGSKDRTVLQLIQHFQEHPLFWQRFFWLASLESKSQVHSVIGWLQTGMEIFSPEFLARLAEEMRVRGEFQPFSDLLRSLGELPRLVQMLSRNSDFSSQMLGALRQHWNQWRFVQGLLQENGRWFGTFFPFWWQNESGVAALSFWQPGQAGQEKEPARLSVLMACQNGWIMQVLLDYRITDLAGAIEVNRADLALVLQDLLPGFRQQLRKKGYTQIGVRVNLVEDLEIDYTQLFPPDNVQQTYAG